MTKSRKQVLKKWFTAIFKQYCIEQKFPKLSFSMGSCQTNQQKYVPTKPQPRAYISVPTFLTVTLSSIISDKDRAIRKPACWMKWRRKAYRAKREASSPVEIHDPPWNTTWEVLVQYYEQIENKSPMYIYPHIKLHYMVASFLGSTYYGVISYGRS